MLTKITEFYKRQGLYSLNFRCCHGKMCKAAAIGDGVKKGDYIEAKASYVGEKYERPGNPCRLLFLSLSSGDKGEDARALALRESRTPEAIRTQQMTFPNGMLPAKWTHWYWTHMLALQVLSPFESDLQSIRQCLNGCVGVGKAAQQKLPEVTPYFAHVNAVKCMLSRTKEPPPKMYDECKGYLPGEFSILRPDIIISQGSGAARAMEGVALNRKPKATNIWSFALEDNVTREVLWIKSHHPRNGRFFNEGGGARHGWPDYVDAVKEFMRIRT